jgi:hypothetical protein
MRLSRVRALRAAVSFSATVVPEMLFPFVSYARYWYCGMVSLYWFGGYFGDGGTIGVSFVVSFWRVFMVVVGLVCL